MLNGNNTVNEELMSEDHLHLSKKGYELWEKIFRENIDEIIN